MSMGGGEMTTAGKPGGGGGAPGGLLALADSPHVPYTIRTLALETLTSLISRRDVVTGTLTNVARQTNVLSELGVGKGQYLGVLPTLIRYSLAALNSFLLSDDVENVPPGKSEDGGGDKMMTNSGERDIGLELGLAFLKATKPPPLPRKEREERALEFIDSVLTLTSAVISVPSGTASLTDCGIIPALVSTVALDSQMAQKKSSMGKEIGEGEDSSYSESLLKFITAQVIQILEGAIVTHNGALTAFHELKGVDVLIRRLNVEVELVKGQKLSDSIIGGEDGKGTNDDEDEEMDEDLKAALAMSMESDDQEDASPPCPNLQAARRVLLFSAVNCLTVVFHQHHDGASAANPNTPSGGAQLRRPELNNVLHEILDNVSSYGGVLAALVATFLSDVMNSDPQVVHFVHKSGLAKSFLSLLLGKEGAVAGGATVFACDICHEDFPSKEEAEEHEKSCTAGDILPGAPGGGSSSGGRTGRAVMSEKSFQDKLWSEEPIVEPSAELIMAIPNVLMALSLTEAGAKSIAESNPFQALLSIFVSPKYVMPNSRCLLNEMSSIIGTGMDELMRHNPSLKVLVLRAIVLVMKRVVYLGKKLIEDEDAATTTAGGEGSEDLETARTRLMQYTSNIAQLLEQILHTDDHIGSFITEGGFDALLNMATYAITPGGTQLVAHVSCLSGPSAGNHLTTSNTLSVLVKSITR